MTRKEANDLKSGLYFLFWTEENGGGVSLASVGRDDKGHSWFAPINWITVPSTDWGPVEKVQMVACWGPNHSILVSDIEALQESLRNGKQVVSKKDWFTKNRLEGMGLKVKSHQEGWLALRIEDIESLIQRVRR
ncbi:MAG: hypothetical protein GF334_00770 [Candidatus Altiarchaeales archaeon]|nr:hypothetical protein [Candidatus Altiarchaeales archaeon]